MYAPKPSWLKVPLPQGQTYHFLKDTLNNLKLHTVCEEARCPNVGECWAGGTATFMIMGDVCTRGCRFCAVKTSKHGTLLDPEEPENLAKAVKAMDLEYVVITSVDRDDLPDQGAQHFANTVKAVKEKTKALVEVLIPDFKADQNAIQIILQSKPDVIAHNLETIKRLTPLVRDRKADYDQSLQVLQSIKTINPNLYTKSSIMLGLGETRRELRQAFQDLRDRRVDFLTLGQYLKPTPKHLDVQQYVTPEEFKELESLALTYGFRYVAAGPLVRSSYRAGEFYVKQLLSAV